MISVLHMADLHLGTPFQYLEPNKRNKMHLEQLRNFHEILQIAKLENVDYISIAGDLFDSIQIENHLLGTVKQELEELKNTQIIINPGNHDYWYPHSLWSSFSSLPNVHVFNPLQMNFYFDEHDITFWGKPFFSQSSINPLWEREDYIYYEQNKSNLNILVQHGDLLNPKSNYNPIYSDMIDKLEFDISLLGHIHTSNEIIYTDKRHLPCLYNGCVMGRGFDEIGEKGVHLIQIDENAKTINSSFLKLKSPQFFEVQINVARFEDESMSNLSQNIIDSVKDKVPQTQVPYHFCRLILTGFTSKRMNIHLLLDKMNEVFFYAEVIDRSKMKIDKEVLLEEHSLRGDVTRYAKQLATKPDLLNQMMISLDFDNMNMQMADRLIEKAYYYTMQAAEQELDLYEN